MTAVASGTSRGKDFVAACVSLCFLYLTPKFNKAGKMVENTKVAMTAPTARQVTNIMTPEVRRLFKSAQVLPGRLVADDIRTDYEEWFLTGFKADENSPESWSGFHAVNTMFVVTEATGISQKVFDAIEGNLQGNSRMLIVFNPNITTGYAAAAMKSSRWNKFRLNSLTAPNVLSHKTIHPGQVDYDWVVDKLENWCVKINKDDVREELDDFVFEGQWYRPEDLFRIKVLGKFPKISEDVLIPTQWVELAQERWEKHSGKLDGVPVMGIDVAGMGRDCSVFCERVGNYVHHIKKHNSGGVADHMRVAGEATSFLSKNPKGFVSIDTIGEGAGVYSRLGEIGLGSRSISCKYSESAKFYDKELTDITGQYKFANMRAYLFWSVRDWLNPKNNKGAMIPPDSGIIEEASEIKWLFRSDGKVIIEPKEDIKKRLGRSTDEFDALANTFYPIAVKSSVNASRLAAMAY
jgi:hypothetical protein